MDEATLRAAQHAANLEPSAYVQWLLAIVLLGGGVLIAWAIRTIVNRFVRAMDKTEAALEGIQAALVRSEEATRSLEGKIGNVAQPVLAGLQGVLGEFKATEEAFFSKNEAAAEKRAAHIVERIDLAHRDLKSEIDNQMGTTRHSLATILTPVILEMSRRGAISSESAEKALRKLETFGGGEK